MKRLARVIFQTFRDGRRNYLLEEDFRPAFATEEEARIAFRVFDKDNNGDLTKREMREAVQRIYKDRKALSASLKVSFVRTMSGKFSNTLTSPGYR